MIYTTCLMIYAGLSYTRSRYFRIFLATALLSLSAFITAYYHYLQDPVFHQAVYALLTTFIVFRSMFIMEYTLRPSLRGTDGKGKDRSLGTTRREQKEQVRKNDRDKDVLKQMWVLVAFGLTVFLGGFGFWALDNVYCSTLRRWRRSIGLPWGILLEGHGWW